MVKFSILMIKGRKIIYSLLQASSIFIVLFEEQSRSSRWQRASTRCRQGPISIYSNKKGDVKINVYFKIDI